MVDEKFTKEYYFKLKKTYFEGRNVSLGLLFKIKKNVKIY